MNRLVTASSLSCIFLLASFALSGCSANMDFPDASANPAVTSPPLAGSVLGGHAPVVGAKVYILSPSTTAYAGPGIAASAANLAKSLMDGDAQNSGTTPTGTGNGLVSSGGSNGYHYVTTDTTGYFNLTGDYACTVDQPVYIVAVGGSATYPSFTNSFALKSATVSNVSGTDSAATATYQFTLSQPPQESYVGETISFSGFTDSASGQNFATAINGNSGTITNITSQTPNTFTVTAPDAFGYVANGTYTVTGLATAMPATNPAIINMAGLGLCPSTGNFSTTTANTFAGSDNGAIPFIVMNEVSTTALAYAMAGFGTDPFHIGVLASNTYGTNYSVNGMKQALYNAFNLYDIAGSNNSTSNPSPGEGHIARSTTPGGNGVVPTALVDTIGNILAACVDSANIAGSASPNCQQLFANATSTGIACTTGPTLSCPTGTTAPTDIATAAFNLAHFPAGVGNSTFVSQLFNIPQGEVPFTPNLAAAPNDYSIALAFTAPASATSGGSLIDAPQTLSIDAGTYVGNESAGGSPQEGVWIGNFSSQAIKLFALTGAPDYATNTALASVGGTTNTRSVAVDTANHIWLAEQNAETLQEFNASGSAAGFYGVTGFTMLSGAAWGQGFLYSSDYGNNSVDVTIPIRGNNYYSIVLLNDNCSTATYSPAFDNNGILYEISATRHTMCAYNQNTGFESAALAGFQSTGTGYLGPATFAAGLGNVVWAPSTTANTVSGVKATTANSGRITLAITNTLTGGGLNNPCSIAVDGSGTVWVGNAGNSSVSAFTPAGTALSPAKTSTANSGGYSPVNLVSNCGNPAIDRAGNVWIAYQGTGSTGPNVIYEIVGAATPTITPLSAAVANGTIGTRP